MTYQLDPDQGGDTTQYLETLELEMFSLIRVSPHVDAQTCYSQRKRGEKETIDEEVCDGPEALHR